MASLRHRLPHEQYFGKRRYFLTLCAYHRRRLFDDDGVVAAVGSEILRCAERFDFAVFAYCFMPDHLHLLVAGTTSVSDLRMFVRVAKQKTGFIVRRQRGTVLWQPSWFDRILRDDENDMAVMAYIVNNPIRAGLVTSAVEWKAWGSQLYERQNLIAAISAGTGRFRM